MTPDLISDKVQYTKTENINTFRQHIHVGDQDDVPDIVAELARLLRAGRATGEYRVKFVQGGCRGIISEQITSHTERKGVAENNDLTAGVIS